MNTAVIQHLIEIIGRARVNGWYGESNDPLLCDALEILTFHLPPEANMEQMAKEVQTLESQPPPPSKRTFLGLTTNS